MQSSSNNIEVRKTSLISIKLAVCMRYTHLQIRQRALKNIIFTLMRKVCMKYYFRANSQNKILQQALLWRVFSSCLTAAYKQDVVRSSLNNSRLWQSDTSYRIWECRSRRWDKEYKENIDGLGSEYTCSQNEWSVKGSFKHTRSG